MHRRGPWLALATVLAAGAVVRLLSLLHMSELPWWTVHDVDSLIYRRVARAIAAGEPLGPEALRMSPGYFRFAGGVYALLGDGPWGFRLVQSALGLMTVALVWDTARHLLGDARWAMLPAALAAFYGPFVFYESVLLASTLAVFVLALLAWTVVRAHLTDPPRLAPWALVGLLWGLTTAVRPNALLLALPLLGDALRKLENDPRPSRARWLRAALVLGCGVLAILPFSLHSSAIAGEPVALTAHGGLNLFVGNGPGANGTFRVPPEVPGSAGPAQQYRAFHEVAERESGRRLSPSEADAYWRDRTLDAIADDPLAWLGLMAKKTRLFFNGRELSNVFDYEFARHVHPVLGAPLPQLAWILPFGVLGMVLLLLPRQRGPPAARVVAVMVLAFAAGVVAVFVVARYRLPAVPLLMITATFAVREIARAIADRRWARLGALVAGLAAATALAWPVSVDKHWDQEYFELAVAWHEQGELTEAERAYRAALDHGPDHLPVRNNLALLYEGQGRAAQAAEQWREVARIARERGRERDLRRAEDHLRRLEAPPTGPDAPR